MFNSNNTTPDLPSSSSDNPFRSDCENPSNFYCFLSFYSSSISPLDDLLNDNTNMSTVSLSSMILLFYIDYYFIVIFIATIVNAALQSNTSRLRLDWPDNVNLLFPFILITHLVFLDV
jgi:hypothetical protein